MMIDTLKLEDGALADDPAVARAERRLRLLEELAEIGMELVRALRPAAEAAEASDPRPAKGRDPVEQYASLSRSLRLTFALEAKTDEALAQLRAGVSQIRQRERVEREQFARAAAEKRQVARIDHVRNCVTPLFEAEAETPEQLDDFYSAIEQRLEEDPAYDDLDASPLREIVERLCVDLCLNPDWSRWTGEGWSAEDRPSRPRCSRFNQPSSRPIWDDQPSHDLE